MRVASTATISPGSALTLYRLIVAVYYTEGRSQTRGKVKDKEWVRQMLRQMYKGTAGSTIQSFGKPIPILWSSAWGYQIHPPSFGVYAPSAPITTATTVVFTHHIFSSSSLVLSPDLCVPFCHYCSHSGLLILSRLLSSDVKPPPLHPAGWF